MTGLDRISLALLADATVDYIEARKELDQEGRTSLTRRGHATSPEYRNLLASSERLLRLLREFGLTPSSRVGVKKSDKPAHGNSKDKTRFIQAVK